MSQFLSYIETVCIDDSRNVKLYESPQQSWGFTHD
jgi:hypothetical protein